jgi:hypothetical protein
MSELSELFSRDPLQHTNESLDELIAKLRGMRGQFALENNKKAGKVKAPAKSTKLQSAGISIDLSGLLTK